MCFLKWYSIIFPIQVKNDLLHTRAYRFGVQVLAVLVVVYILQVLAVLYILQVMAVLYLFIYFIVDE